MRRSRLAAGRAGHVRKRGQPHGRQRNVGSPRGPHLMVSTPMVYGYAIGVFNSEDISAECSGEKPPSRPRIPCVYGLEIGGRRRTWLWGIRVPVAVSRFARKTHYFGMGGGTWLLHRSILGVFLGVSPSRNYPRYTCANTLSCYTCNCCFRAGWNSPLAVNRAVSKGRRGTGEMPTTEPMSPRPVRVLVRMPAELVRSQYQRLESG